MNFEFILTRFFEAFHIPVHLYNENNQELIFRLGFDEPDPWIEDPMLFPTLFNELKQQTNPYVYSEFDMVLTVLFAAKPGMIVTLGPICLYRDAVSLSREYSQSHRLHESLRLPTADWFSFGSAVSLLYYIFSGNEIDGQELLHLHIADDPTPLNENHLLQEYILNESEIERKKYNYEQERRKMQSIVDGDIETIRKEISPDEIRISQDLIGQFSDLPKKQWEYSAVSSIVLSCRAAIVGGLPVETSYSLSDTMLQRLTYCENIQQILLLQSEVRMTFASAVRDHKIRNTNTSCVETAKNYISRHLNKSLSLDNLALACDVSKEYLCRKFKATTGKTVMQYIYEERTQVAKDLLRYSTEPISYISEYLCFSSQSHFTQIFRKYTGQTPLQYRRQMAHA